MAKNGGAGVQANISGGGTSSVTVGEFDAVEQRQRVASTQRCVLAQLQEQPGDRPGRHGSFRPGQLSIGHCVKRPLRRRRRRGRSLKAQSIRPNRLRLQKPPTRDVFMMAKSTLLSTFLGALFVAGLAIAPAHAQATRTWISGVGDDVNPCSRTAPCKTWPGAISKTAAGGEIDALDPGGFGTVTITKSITLDGGGGQVASILSSPGVNGVNVSAQATDVIILRNLRINGAGGATGVQVNTAAKVIIEKCDIFGFATAAVNVTPSSATTVNVKIQETTLNNNNAGVSSKPTGGATVNMSIDHSLHRRQFGGGMKSRRHRRRLIQRCHQRQFPEPERRRRHQRRQRGVGQCRDRLDARHHRPKMAAPASRPISAAAAHRRSRSANRCCRTTAARGRHSTVRPCSATRTTR